MFFLKWSQFPPKPCTRRTVGDDGDEVEGPCARWYRILCPRNDVKPSNVPGRSSTSLLSKASREAEALKSVFRDDEVRVITRRRVGGVPLVGMGAND